MSNTKIAGAIYCYSTYNIFMNYKERTNVLMAKFLEELYIGYQQSKKFRKLSFDDQIEVGKDFYLLKRFIETLQQA